MIGAPVDSKQLIYLPAWVKVAVTALFLLGVSASALVVVRFVGADDSFDWLLLGISGVQFSVTALATFLILSFSQTDANVRNLERRADSFLCDLLPEKLAAITFPGMAGERLTVERGSRRDLFGYDYVFRDSGVPVFRLWCGVNVSRIIVIYFMRNPRAEAASGRFVARLRRIFAFSLGGAEKIGYGVNYEPVPARRGLVSVWVGVSASADLLTDSAAKLFWAQDVAMMTESVLRTALRHPEDVLPELETAPAPL